MGASRSLRTKVVILGLSALAGAGNAALLQAQTPLPAATQFYTIDPCRAVDTRESAEGPLLPGVVRLFSVDGCGVPLSAFAVVFNVTVVDTVGSVEVSAFPGDQSPVISTIVAAGPSAPTRAAQAVLKLAADGTIGVLGTFSTGFGQAHLVLDVTGYFDVEDPGSTEDPGGADSQSTLGLPVQDYEGDPLVLDYPELYPPERIGSDPSAGYTAVAAPMDCSAYPPSGASITPIGVWGNSPRYLAYAGQVQLLVGASADVACHFLPTPTNHQMVDKCNAGATNNYVDVLTGLHNAGLNKIRLWVALGWEKDDDNLPFLKVGGKWQLDQPNTDYFDRLRAVVSKAKELGMFVEVTFFSPFQGPNNGYSAGPWSFAANLAQAHVPAPNGPLSRVGFTSMYYAVVNDTRPGADGDKNRRMRDYQKNVIQWTIDKLWCYDNVFWEIANEAEDQHVMPLQVAQWQSDMIDWVIKNDCKKSSPTDTTCLTPYGQRTALTRRHLIAVQPFTRPGAGVFVEDARVSILNGHYTQVLTDRAPTFPNPPADSNLLNLGAIQLAQLYSSRNKVLGFNETKITPLAGTSGVRRHRNGNPGVGLEGARAEAWEFLFDRGGVMDHWGYLSAGGASSPLVAAIRDHLFKLKSFMASAPLSRLKSSPVGPDNPVNVKNPVSWITGGTLTRYPAGTDFWDTLRGSQRYWAALQTDENASTGRWFLLYIHRSTRRCGARDVETEFTSTGCASLGNNPPPGPYLAFGGYDARVWTPSSANLYRDSFNVLLGPNPGTFDVFWIDPATYPQVVKQQAIAWKQSSCSLPNCVACVDPANTPCTIGLNSSEGYAFDSLLKIVQR